MSNRPASHRAAGLARRDALLRATVELVAERGIGRTTHRAIADRAGVPLSTTSYFFGSIDEMITEALREVVERSVAGQEAVLAALSDHQLSQNEAIDRLIEYLVTSPATELVAQLEAYLDSSRRPDLRPAVHAAISTFESFVVTALVAAGIDRPQDAAQAFVALSDGFAIHRVAFPRAATDRDSFASAIRALLAGYASDPGAAG